jgi:hypothetical protein
MGRAAPPGVITFKVSRELLEQLEGMENRSEFIRTALLEALGHLCPLCRGTGILTPKKQEHWKEFSRDHTVKACRECHELRIVCENE